MTALLQVRGFGPLTSATASSVAQALKGAGVEVVDWAQFQHHGTGVLFAQVKASGSHEALKKKLVDLGKQHGVDLDLVPAQTSSLVGEEALVTLTASEDFPVSLLVELDSILSEHQCTITKIEPDFSAAAGDIKKLVLKLCCPAGTRLSTLLLGAPGAPKKGLQEVAWRHKAEIALRWSEHLPLLNGKSFVAFGLSELLDGDALAEVLKAAGAAATNGKDSLKTKKMQGHEALLKGKPASVVDKVLANIKYAKGAKLTCCALKRMGCTLALVSEIALKSVAERVGKELGMDYVNTRDMEVKEGLFTGEYAGELTDVKFRNADLLNIMAGREKIDLRNVVGVGVSDLPDEEQRELLEGFGQILHLSPGAQRDLTPVLYMLGMNSFEIDSMRKRRPLDASEAAPNVAAPPAAKRRKVQLAGSKLAPGFYSRLLAAVPKGSVLGSLSQHSSQGGGVSVTFEFGEAAAEAACQGLSASSGSEGYKMLPAAKECASVAAEPAYLVTVVQQPALTTASLEQVLATFDKCKVEVLRTQKMTKSALAGVQFLVSLPAATAPEQFSKDLVATSKAAKIDISFQKDDIDRLTKRVVVFDMDSTLIQQEVIDELAKIAGVETAVKTITEAAMRGEIDFFESLKQRVALLKGHNAEKLFSAVKANIVFTPGAKKLCTALKRLGFKLAVISGGFLPVAKEVQAYLGLDYAFANTLEVDEATGLLTGKTFGPVVTPQRKRALLATIAGIEGCDLAQTIAVGDGANDIPMLHASGLGVAFCAKPKVQDVAEFRVNTLDLSTVLYLIGISEEASERLP